jgi:3-hydroxyacyl-CoA dehydrogenase
MAASRETSLIPKQFHRIGIVGAGSMGTQMAIAFSELGLEVSIWDVNEKKRRQASGVVEKRNKNQG